MTTPTPDELRAAWKAMSQRRSLRHWPATFEEVMADSLRARLVSIEATAARRQTVGRYVTGLQTAITQARYLPKVGRQQGHPNHPWPPTVSDLKRAAAGDLDD
jgi:hypothetical protein